MPPTFPLFVAFLLTALLAPVVLTWALISVTRPQHRQRGLRVLRTGIVGAVACTLVGGLLLAALGEVPGFGLVAVFAFGFSAFGVAVPFLWPDPGGHTPWYRPRYARPLGVVAGVLLSLVLVGVARSAWYDIEQWNPYPIPSAALVGTWRAGNSLLEVRPDGSYRLLAEGQPARRFGVQHSAGTWRLDDYNLDLTDSSGAVRELRLIVAGGEYRIIEQPGDLDGWLAWRGLGRTPISPARPCESCE